METVPQTVNIRHPFIHKNLRYQKLHGAMEGAPSAYSWIRHCVLSKPSFLIMSVVYFTLKPL